MHRSTARLLRVLLLDAASESLGALAGRLRADTQIVLQSNVSGATLSGALTRTQK